MSQFGYFPLAHGATQGLTEPDFVASDIDFDWNATNTSFADDQLLDTGAEGQVVGELRVREQTSADVNITTNELDIDASASAAADFSGVKDPNGQPGANGTIYVCDTDHDGGVTAIGAIAIANTDHSNANIDTTDNWHLGLDFKDGATNDDWAHAYNGTDVSGAQSLMGAKNTVTAANRRFALITGGWNSSGEPYRSGQTRADFQFGGAIFSDGVCVWRTPLHDWTDETMWGNFLARDEAVQMDNVIVDHDQQVMNEADGYDASVTSPTTYDDTNDSTQSIMFKVGTLGSGTIILRQNWDGSDDSGENRWTIGTDGSVAVQTFSGSLPQDSDSAAASTVSSGDTILITGFQMCRMYVNGVDIDVEAVLEESDDRVKISFSGTSTVDWVASWADETGIAAL